MFSYADLSAGLFSSYISFGYCSDKRAYRFSNDSDSSGTILSCPRNRTPKKKFDYTPKPCNTHPFPYPAPGKVVDITYLRENLEIKLVYEIFDDMPAVRKSLYVKNNGDRTVTVDTAETEALALTDDGVLRYYPESDYTGDNMTGFSNGTSLFRDGSKVLRDSADMLTDIGFDMIIQSFGSGVNLESENPDYLARVKSDYDYVHSRGLKIGGYPLPIIRDYSPINHDCATNGCMTPNSAAES